MAQPANTFDSYDYANAIAEDISDVIYNITPFETPFMTRTPKTSASNTFHEWLQSSLRASTTNAHIEGTRLPPRREPKKPGKEITHKFSKIA